MAWKSRKPCPSASAMSVAEIGRTTGSVLPEIDIGACSSRDPRHWCRGAAANVLILVKQLPSLRPRPPSPTLRRKGLRKKGCGRPARCEAGYGARRNRLFLRPGVALLDQLVEFALLLGDALRGSLLIARARR